MKSWRKSFTLIELLVVIAIIGILSSLVIARFSDWNDKARIANTLQWSSGAHRKIGANLVGHWPLNGNADDVSGYNNHCKWKGGNDPIPSLKWQDGITGAGSKSFEFNGTDDYLDCGNNSILNVGDNITYSAWVKIKVYSTDANIGQCIAGSYSPGYIFSLRGMEGGGAKLHLRPHGGSGGSVGDPSNIDLNKWYHVAGSHNGSSIKLYVNGVMKDSNTYTGATNQARMIMGRASWGSGHFLNGFISDIRLYSTALTAEEVSRIYAESKDQYLAHE